MAKQNSIYTPAPPMGIPRTPMVRPNVKKVQPGIPLPPAQQITLPNQKSVPHTAPSF